MKKPVAKEVRQEAWQAWSVGDRVQKFHPRVPLSPSVEDNTDGCRERTVFRCGTVIEKLTTPGGLPEVWVQWDGERVPESPERLLSVLTSVPFLNRQEVAA